MILTIDVGNTNIVIGGYDGDDLTFVSRIHTNLEKTSDEYAVLLTEILKLNNINIKTTTGAIIASVVPKLETVFKLAIEKLINIKPIIVTPDIKCDVNVKIDNPLQIGVDLLATAVGSFAKYQGTSIIIDFGTATKITVVDENGNFIGGSILPGVMIGLNALSSKTAQLPNINLYDGELNTIGTNTVDCMKSGVILGTASMVDGMVNRYQEHLGVKANVIVCGGLASAITPHCSADITKDDNLLLYGLKTIYTQNTGICI